MLRQRVCPCARDLPKTHWRIPYCHTRVSFFERCSDVSDDARIFLLEDDDDHAHDDVAHTGVVVAADVGLEWVGVL